MAANVMPFPEGILAGVASPEEMAAKARKHSKEAVPLFEKGLVEAWYQINGWAYPVKDPVHTGPGAMDKYLQAVSVGHAGGAAKNGRSFTQKRLALPKPVLFALCGLAGAALFFPIAGFLLKKVPDPLQVANPGLTTQPQASGPGNNLSPPMVAQKEKEKGEASQPKSPFSKISPADENKAIDAYNAAVRAYRQELGEDALKHLKEALVFNPRFPQAYRLRADLHLSKGRLKEAAADAARAAELAPKDKDAYLTLAQAHVGLGKTEQAIDDLFQVLKLDPDHAEARHNFLSLALGMFRDLIPSTPPPPPSTKEGLPPVLPLPSIPGSPPGVLWPLGGLNINVLHYVVVDTEAAALTLLGEYDPQWPTGPIPYLEILQAAWKQPGPAVDLKPGPEEVARLAGTLKRHWAQKILQAAQDHPDDPQTILLLEANCGWKAGEARQRSQRLFGQAGAAAQYEEIRDFARRFEEFRKNGFWFPPSFLEKFGNLDVQIPVKFSAAVEDSQMARILFQADYCLKQATEWLPLERQIPGFLTFSHFCRRRQADFSANLEQYRWSLQPDKVRLVYNQAGGKMAVRLPECRLRLVGASVKSSLPEDIFSAYAQLWNKRYPALVHWFPVLHELREAVKVHALALFLRQKNVHLAFPVQTWNPWERLATVRAPFFALLYPHSLEKFSFEPQGGISLGRLEEELTTIFDSGGEIPPAIYQLQQRPFEHKPIKTDRSLSTLTVPLRMDGNAALMNSRPLGSLSERYESGGRGPATISGGQGDPGGISYGVYQMSSTQGTVEKFVKKYYQKEFAGLNPGTAEFNLQWQQLAQEQPVQFRYAQHQFIRETHYDPVVQRLQRLGLDVNRRSRALQNVIWSTGVQHRPGSHLVDNVVAELAKKWQPISDEELIRGIYAERGRTDDHGVPVHFRRSSPRVQRDVLRRFAREQQEALRQLSQERER